MTAARNSDSAYLTRIQNQSGIVPHFAPFRRRRERAGALPPSCGNSALLYATFPLVPFLFPFPYLFFIFTTFLPASRDSSRRSSHSWYPPPSRVELFAERHERRDTLLGYIALRLSCTSCDVNLFRKKTSQSGVPSESQRDRARP